MAREGRSEVDLRRCCSARRLAAMNAGEWEGRGAGHAGSKEELRGNGAGSRGNGRRDAEVGEETASAISAANPTVLGGSEC